MKFSTKTTYGLRSIIKIAINKGKSSVSLASISREEGISLKYLERIFSLLKKAGIVDSEKGVSGGYFLADKAENISVHDIVSALEGDMNLFHCIGEDGKMVCSKKCDCSANWVLDKVQNSINSSLKKMSLKDLL